MNTEDSRNERVRDTYLPHPVKSKKEPPTMNGWNENTAKRDTSKAADHSRWFGTHKPFQNDFQEKEKWREEIGDKRYKAHLADEQRKHQLRVEMENRRNGK